MFQLGKMYLLRSPLSPTSTGSCRGDTPSCRRPHSLRKRVIPVLAWKHLLGCSEGPEMKGDQSPRLLSAPLPKVSLLVV